MPWFYKLELFKCREDNTQSNLIQLYLTLLGRTGLTIFWPYWQKDKNGF